MCLGSEQHCLGCSSLGLRTVAPKLHLLDIHTVHAARLISRPGRAAVAASNAPAAAPAAAVAQGATRSLVAPLSKGCDWGQDVPAMLRQLPGISISSQQRHLAGTLVSIAATKQA
jgi:hypothetical protein